MAGQGTKSASPLLRAKKRLAEATGVDASTVNRWALYGVTDKSIAFLSVLERLGVLNNDALKPLWGLHMRNFQETREILGRVIADGIRKSGMEFERWGATHKISELVTDASVQKWARGEGVNNHLQLLITLVALKIPLDKIFPKAQEEPQQESPVTDNVGANAAINALASYTFHLNRFLITMNKGEISDAILASYRASWLRLEEYNKALLASFKEKRK